jgi:hypothetical protein
LFNVGGFTWLVYVATLALVTCPHFNYALILIQMIIGEEEEAAVCFSDRQVALWSEPLT